MIPKYIGRLVNGTEYAMITIPPEKRPADPTPAIARPRINPIEFGVAPQRSEPSSNMVIEMRNTHLIGNST